MLPDPRRDALLREALVRRKDEVAELVVTRGATSTGPVGAVPEDVEETLRIVMVRLWPKVKRGDASSTQLAEYVTRLLQLEGAAGGDDLRFLDAWNNAFEVLDHHDDSDDMSRFLVAYARILEAHIERLAA